MKKIGNIVLVILILSMQAYSQQRIWGTFWEGACLDVFNKTVYGDDGSIYVIGTTKRHPTIPNVCTSTTNVVVAGYQADGVKIFEVILGDPAETDKGYDIVYSNENGNETFVEKVIYK